jgi:hypothetical protein
LKDKGLPTMCLIYERYSSFNMSNDIDQNERIYRMNRMKSPVLLESPTAWKIDRRSVWLKSEKAKSQSPAAKSHNMVIM